METKSFGDELLGNHLTLKRAEYPDNVCLSSFDEKYYRSLPALPGAKQSANQRDFLRCIRSAIGKDLVVPPRGRHLGLQPASSPFLKKSKRAVGLLTAEPARARPSADNPAESKKGCYACQKEDYDRFKPFFSKVLAE